MKYILTAIFGRKNKVQVQEKKHVFNTRESAKTMKDFLYGQTSELNGENLIYTQFSADCIAELINKNKQLEERVSQLEALVNL